MGTAPVRAAPRSHRYRRGANRIGGSGSRGERDLSRVGGIFHHAGTDGRVSGPGFRAPQLRLVRLFQRPRRQRMVAARDNGSDPPIDAKTSFSSASELTSALRRGDRSRRTREPDRPRRSIRTGRRGTPNTWSPNRPVPNCPNENTVDFSGATTRSLSLVRGASREGQSAGLRSQTTTEENPHDNSEPTCGNRKIFA